MLKLIKAVLGLLLLGSMAFSAGPKESPLNVVATVPELGSLASEIGGDQVTVSVMAKGTEDAHFVEARPSFIKLLSRADVYIQIGMELEAGYAPLLLSNCRNGKILAGREAHIDCSSVIKPLEVPVGAVDRAMGDVHPFGNPHYLTDPLNGLRVAELLRDRFGALRESKKEYFAGRCDAFRQRLAEALVGKELAKKHDFEKLAVLHEKNELVEFLKKQGDEKLLGGWIGAMVPYHGTKAVADHNLYAYFGHRFGVIIAGTLEPKPGIQPSTNHLNAIIKMMKAQEIKLIFAASYYDLRHARFVAENTGAKVLPMAHQVGSREGTNDVISMIDCNVKQIVGALGGAK